MYVGNFECENSFLSICNYLTFVSFNVIFESIGCKKNTALILF